MYKDTHKNRSILYVFLLRFPIMHPSSTLPWIYMFFFQISSSDFFIRKQHDNAWCIHRRKYNTYVHSQNVIIIFDF